MPDAPRLVSWPGGGAFLHPCEVCGAHAGFGYGVSVRRGQLGRWRCWSHRLPAAAPAPRQPTQPKPPAQGTLL